MKKIYILLVILGTFYGCSSKEVIQPVVVRVVIVENTETEKEIAFQVKRVPLYEEKIKYLGELPSTEYIFTRKRSNVRKEPKVGATRIGITIPHKKMEMLEKVAGSSIKNNKFWYKVKYHGKIGYIHSSVVEKRSFEFEEMAKKVRKLELFLNKATLENKSIERIVAYEPETKEEEETPKDSYGNRGEQSVVGKYLENGNKEGFRYLQDGRIVVIQGKVEKKEEEEKIRDEVKIKIPDSTRDYTIGEDETRKLNLNDGIKKVILVDIKNQTESAFEKEGDVWKLVGYNVVTSGKNDNKHAYDTPKGYFIVQNTLTYILFSYKEKVLLESAIEREEEKRVEYEKKQEERVKKIENSRKMSKEARLMSISGETLDNIQSENSDENLVLEPFEPEYTEEDYEEVTKYSRANYGIRFSGGGYLHGIPLKEETTEKLEEEGGDEAVVKRKKASEINLGTFKASHKCVRNVEDFQSFLYHEFIGQEDSFLGKRWRLPKENVAVIVF